MSDIPHIENGFAIVGAGSWLVRRGQPAVSQGFLSVRGLKGFVVPDRRMVQEARTEKTMWLGLAGQPFLTYLPCTEHLTVVSSKLLVAPFAARKSARMHRVIPMSFRYAFPTTQLGAEWGVMATRSRLMRITLAEDEMITVRLESAVAWTGKDPTGFCPKLKMRNLLFPNRSQVALSLTFYGPQIVWVEGCNEL